MDPACIWLEPFIQGAGAQDRAWCDHNVWEDEFADIPPAVAYIRADLVAEKDAEIARLRAALARLAHFS